jgi:MFS family permease
MTADEAGLGRVSLVSLAGGLLCAYGLFAIVAALIAAVLDAVDADTDFRTDDWTSSGAGALAASAVALFVAYLLGGYVAGRMARRSGVVHGILLVVATLIVGAIAGGIVSGLTDDDQIRSNLRSIGVPTETGQIEDVAIAGVLVSLLAIIGGAVLGGMLGERWHTRLAERLADPTVGRTAAEHLAVAHEDERRRQVAEGEAMRRHQDLEGEQQQRRAAIGSDATLAGEAVEDPDRSSPSSGPRPTERSDQQGAERR